MVFIIGTWDWQTTFKSDGKADERSSIYLIYIYMFGIYKCLIFSTKMVYKENF